MKKNKTTKTTGQIIFTNVCTLFNLINIVLGILVLAVGSPKNALFLLVAILNLLIGIVQEIRAKRVVDKLSLITAPVAHVIRDGVLTDVPVAEISVGETAVLSIGDQVYADMEVIEGSCSVNESMVTGESKPVTKKPGSEMKSGSFIVSGTVKVKFIRVGDDCYAAKLAAAAKYMKKPNSQLKSGIDKIIKIVSIAIVPMGIILYLNQILWQKILPDVAVIHSVAALIGMIPEGLVLLSTIALSVSVIRLGQSRTLVKELYSVETLARVDTLCLDKTGTITEGKMKVEDLIVLEGSEEEVSKILGTYTASVEDYSPTFAAMKEHFTEGVSCTTYDVVPFDSVRKWSAARFAELGADTFVLGAPEIVFFAKHEDKAASIREKAEQYTAYGRRVLMLARTAGEVSEEGLPEDILPLALVVVSDIIRENAAETIKYFKDQGVDIKIISGDNAKAVSCIAAQVGVEGAEKYIDVTTLSDEELAAAASRYSVFGRVRPEQKLCLIKSLKAAGKTVAMIGDGVNDIPALKASDCSVVMASGSDAAKGIAEIVLLDSDFSNMPKVVAEGRRAINNLTRSASLFLTKTIFSFILTLFFLAIPVKYPFMPIQLTLISALCIGVPSFVLALQPNKDIVTGSFIKKVLKRAWPAGVGVALLVLASAVILPLMGVSAETTSLVVVIATAAVMFVNLFFTCRPFNKLRVTLFVLMVAAFAVAVLFFGGFFGIDSSPFVE